MRRLGRIFTAEANGDENRDDMIGLSGARVKGVVRRHAAWPYEIGDAIQALKCISLPPSAC